MLQREARRWLASRWVAALARKRRVEYWVAQAQARLAVHEAEVRDERAARARRKPERKREWQRRLAEERSRTEASAALRLWGAWRRQVLWRRLARASEVVRGVAALRLQSAWRRREEARRRLSEAAERAAVEGGQAAEDARHSAAVLMQGVWRRWQQRRQAQARTRLLAEAGVQAFEAEAAVEAQLARVAAAFEAAAGAVTRTREAAAVVLADTAASTAGVDAAAQTAALAPTPTRDVASQVEVGGWAVGERAAAEAALRSAMRKAQTDASAAREVAAAEMAAALSAARTAAEEEVEAVRVAAEAETAGAVRIAREEAAAERGAARVAAEAQTVAAARISGGRQRRIKRELAQARDRAELGALVGAAECRLAAMAGGGDQWRSVVEGRLQAARAQWSATQRAEVDYSQRLLQAASAAGVTVVEGTLV